MQTENWPESVKFELSPGHYDIVGSTEEAARLLLSEWPVSSGAKFLEAKATCIDVLSGRLPADFARRAFIAACEEADMHVMT